MADSITKRLLNFFGVGYKKGKMGDEIYPTAEKYDDKKDTYVRKREIFPPEVEKYFDRWMHSTHDDAESWKNRRTLWQDMDMLFYNSGITSYAMELMADEVVQSDTHEQPIGVEAPQKQKKFIQDLFDKINLYSFIRSTALDIIQYGNAGWILSFDNKGVDGIIPTNIYDLKDRLEFSAHEIAEKIKNQDKFLFNYKSKVQRIEQLIDMIENKDNIVSYFKTYLFGFQVGEYVLPPWRFLHFRNMTSKSPFKPFGVPVFIHSVGPYRQYDSAMTMQMAARGARFPIDVYKLSFPNTMKPSDKMENALQFMSDWQNSGINEVNKEETGVGESIVTIEGLFDFEQKESNIDLGKIDDIEMLKEDLMASIFIPRYLIDPADSGFGESGVALSEKSKPFARQIYRIQQILLQEISQLVKIHMIHTGEFALEDIDFILTMPYPESMVNDEMISNQSDLLRLANDVIDALADQFADGDKELLPAETLKAIYLKFLPYNDKTIDEWIDNIIKNKKKASDSDGDFFERELYARQKIKWKKLIEQYGSESKLNEAIDHKIFEIKQKKLREGVLRGKHYFSSKNQDVCFPAELLRELDIKKLKAKDGSKLKLSEVTEIYEFQYDSKSKNQTKKKKKKNS